MNDGEGNEEQEAREQMSNSKESSEAAGQWQDEKGGMLLGTMKE